MNKYKYNIDSFDNAIEVNNYPWGFRLKTKRRYWIETTKNGDRFCYCTLNPKNNKWCAVKKSTYDAVKVIYIADNGYVKTNAVYKYGVNKDEIEKFLSDIDYEQLSTLQKKQICKLKAVNKVMEKVKFTIDAGKTYNLSDPVDLARMRADANSPETKQKELEQNQIKARIAGAINGTYNQCLIKNNLK